MRTVMIAIALLAMVAGCGSRQGRDGGSTLTEAQRDSVLGRTGLPGTDAIGHTMARSDAESRRAEALNAQVDSLPH